MQEPVNPFQPPGSLVDEVVRVLTDRIVRGTLAPGTRLVEERLAREFGISRQPIRESFRILQREGLVSILPRRGVYVKATPPEEIVSIYQCRAALGALSARLATRRMPPATLAELETLVDEMAARVAAGDVEGYFQRNVRFHDLVHQTSGNRTLQNLLRTLGTQVLRLRFTSMSLPGRMAESLATHQEMVAAFRAGDADRAGQLSAKLIDGAAAALLARVAPEVAEGASESTGNGMVGAAAHGAARRRS
ncbi:MAG TPA: GntR family transcriptional regulator [Chloroflexota bacterium]|nr:GntR family transcriptional regulator [Chloroflexota bacterium]